MVTKAMPYAVCNVFLGAKVGTEFLIPGYKLRNEKKDSEKLLVLRMNTPPSSIMASTPG